MTQMMATSIEPGRQLVGEPSGGRAWWFLGTLAVLRNPEGAPLVPAVIELTVPPGSSPPRHIHDDLDDSFLVVEGEAVICCGDRMDLAGPGAYVVLPRGIEHSFRVTSEHPAKLLLIHADDSFLRFIEAVGTPTDERRLPPPDHPAPGEDTVSSACAEHGMRFVGPSLEPDQIPPGLQG